MSVIGGGGSGFNEPLAPRPYKCGVCLGAGAWDKLTGHPIFTKPKPEDAQVCHYCHGTGRLHRPEFGQGGDK